MTKMMLALVAAMFVSAPAMAQLTTAAMEDGRYASPADSPCIPFVIGQATATAEVLITSAISWINWIEISTGAVTSYVVVRDTGSLLNQGNGVTVMDKLAAITASPQQFNFRPPFRMANGITAKLAGSGDVGQTATICYRKYSGSAK